MVSNNLNYSLPFTTVITLNYYNFMPYESCIELVIVLQNIVIRGLVGRRVIFTLTFCKMI